MKEYVDLVIADTKGPFSGAIKAVTFSKWSHTAMIVDPLHVVEATFKHGVGLSPLQDLIARSNKGVIVRVPVESRARTLAVQRSLLGKPYDLKGALGLGFGRNWQDDSDFWCSEANYYAIHESGNHYYRADAMHRITPEHLWMLNFEVVHTF